MRDLSTRKKQVKYNPPTWRARSNGWAGTSFPHPPPSRMSAGLSVDLARMKERRHATAGLRLSLPFEADPRECVYICSQPGACEVIKRSPDTSDLPPSLSVIKKVTMKITTLFSQNAPSAVLASLIDLPFARIKFIFDLPHRAYKNIYRRGEKRRRTARNRQQFMRNVVITAASV